MLDFVLQKASIGVEPHYLGVWVPAHLGAKEAAKKHESNIFYSCAYPFLYSC
jgi:hypothetical protein